MRPTAIPLVIAVSSWILLQSHFDCKINNYANSIEPRGWPTHAQRMVWRSSICSFQKSKHRCATNWSFSRSIDRACVRLIYKHCCKSHIVSCTLYQWMPGVWSGASQCVCGGEHVIQTTTCERSQVWFRTVIYIIIFLYFNILTSRVRNVLVKARRGIISEFVLEVTKFLISRTSGRRGTCERTLVCEAKWNDIKRRS